MQLHFREYGSGHPVIILHGLFGSLNNWATISHRLAAQFHVFAVDQRNHGGSVHSPEMNYDVMASDIRRFMDRHSIASAHVLGHSMGGKSAMQFALVNTDRIDRLVVVDIAPRAYRAAHEHLFRAMLAIDPAQFGTRREIDHALAASIPDTAVRRFL